MERFFGLEEATIITLNFDELKNKNNDLILEIEELKKELMESKNENNSLQIELESANKRNRLLQNILVEVDERVPETLFVEKVKGFIK